MNLRGLEAERSLDHAALRGLDLREQMRDVDAAMGRGERCESSRSLLELARGRDGTAAARLVPGDRDVDEPLEEIALLR